ncbi:hypothetical protein N7462_003862, partial [Penicillium macrosclerotiorum]|uniref:uncharacterized protein n=1 Tax=Penicillium macrosclerotiorum TaxID=303699 RepID=UPI002548BD2D
SLVSLAASAMSDGNVTVASNVLGTIGTVLWCIQLIPQIWYNYRRKKTDGFPAAMMFLWASCSVPMGAYLILQEVNIPLQIQPQIFGFFSVVSWSQILYYNHNFSRLKACLVCFSVVLLFGGIEALLILTLRIPYKKGVTWPDLVVGVVAAILLSAGLLPPYFELWKRDGRVIGFNWVFLSIDTLGGLFSLFALGMIPSWSVAVKPDGFQLTHSQLHKDLLISWEELCIYWLFLMWSNNRVVLESGIYVSHIIWRIRYRKLRKEAKATGKSIDDLLDLERNDTEETNDPQTSVLAMPGEKTDPLQSTEQPSRDISDVERGIASEKF